MEVGDSFESFSEFEEALNRLRKSGYHPLRVFNSQSAKDYNKKRVSAKNPIDPVDEENVRYTYYSVRCVHYGEARHRGKGLRPNQRSFSMGCPAKLTVSYERYVCINCNDVSALQRPAILVHDLRLNA